MLDHHRIPNTNPAAKILGSLHYEIEWKLGDKKYLIHDVTSDERVAAAEGSRIPR